MSNDYVAKVVLRTPLPRSRRQRGQGVVGSAVASIVPDGVTDHAQLSGRYDPDAHPLNAITGLAEFKGLFDSMFERVNLGTDAAPEYAIKAKLDLFSVGGITAYGNGSGGGGGSGSAVWGGIVGTLSNQTDLMTVLAEKSNVGHTHAYDTISGRPSLALVATSGSYNDLTDKPTIPSLTALSQLTDNLGSNPVHTHSQYLPSSVAATTYHPKGGSTALPLSASSLTLAGAISGATDITSSGTATMKEIVLSNNGHTLKIELDASGNLKINGNVLATGGVTSYQSN